MTFRKSLMIVLTAELLVAVFAFSVYGFDITGLQAVTRFSGRVSLLIFSLIFILLPYHRTQLNKLLSDRFFLIFAIAHGLHLVELLAYIFLSGGALIPLRAAGGALAYAMIFIMPVISHTLAGRKKTIIENIYLFYVAFIFFMTYFSRVQGKLTHVGGSYIEFVILFTWVCTLFVIRGVLTIDAIRKS